MLLLRRACTNRSIHLLFVAVLVATLIVITLDYGKSVGKSELLDQITSGRVQDASLLNRLKNALHVKTENTENSKATPAKEDKSMEPKQKSTKFVVNKSNATRSASYPESTTFAKPKTSKSMPATTESESKPTKHQLKLLTESRKTDDKRENLKEPKQKTQDSKNAETTTANKPEPKPPVTIKPIEKKGPPRLPSDIIDVDKVYPDHPPDITWPDDVIIQLPQFDATNPVPNILHLAWYSSKKRGTDLKLHHYISFLSAYKRLKPKRILFWYDERPTGLWWEKIAKTTKSVLQLVKRASPKEIFGNPVVVPEHHSDVVRLEAVMYYGGVYIDLDVIILKDFAPLYKYNTTMGYEVSYGLCNGIIVSKAAAPFLTLWYDRYRTFNDSKWSEHSVMLPATLAKQNPTLIHTEATSMHKPYWGELKKIYDEGVYFDWSNNYSIHLWYRLHGREHTIEEINTMNTTYGQISRYTMYDSPAIIKKSPSISKTTEKKT